MAVNCIALPQSQSYHNPNYVYGYLLAAMANSFGVLKGMAIIFEPLLRESNPSQNIMFGKHETQ